MESYEPYAATFKRHADFRVKYQFLPKENDEPRYVIQGSRLDFRYDNDGYLHNSHYIIWPEFEDNGGFIILIAKLPAINRNASYFCNHLIN